MYNEAHNLRAMHAALALIGNPAPAPVGVSGLEEAVAKLMYQRSRTGIADTVPWEALSEQNKRYNRTLAADILALDQSPPPVPALKGGHLNHVANEWADMATSGLQWLRNIRDGISTPEEAIENMLSNLKHCREVSAPKGEAELVADILKRYSWTMARLHEAELTEAKGGTDEASVERMAFAFVKAFHEFSSKATEEIIGWSSWGDFGDAGKLEVKALAIKAMRAALAVAPPAGDGGG